MKRIVSLILVASLIAPLSLFAASSSVDLLWQGSGYVPPFYQGKELWGRQTGITFFALPHVFSSSGKELPASSLIYRWSKDGSVLGDISGTGQNTLSLQDTILGIPISIHVDVLTDPDTIAASADTILSPILPSVLVYENSPLYGYLFNRESSQGIVMSSKEIALSAFPLFFSAGTKNSIGINYSWTSAGTNTQTGENVIYRTADNTKGTISIHISADAPNILTQSAERSFLVQLNGNGNAN